MCEIPTWCNGHSTHITWDELLYMWVCADGSIWNDETTLDASDYVTANGGVSLPNDAAVDVIAQLVDSNGGVITGNLWIGERVTSLTGLEGVSEIQGDVYITSNDHLTSLAGLDGLITVEGDLYIEDNTALTSLDGLQNLEGVYGDLYIWLNDQLTSLDGLKSLTSVEGSFTIMNNDQLTSLTGLDELTSVEDDLVILGNPQLTSLDGLEALTRVGQDLYITKEQTSKQDFNFDALVNLAEVGGSVNVQRPDGESLIQSLDELILEIIN